MTTQPAAGSRLGRGLATLIGEVEHESGAPAPSGIRTVPTAFLRPNPHNPRKNFDDGALDELTASVREKGVVQPLIVRVVGEVPNSYEIIAGERRWRAAQRAGLHDVPVIVRDVSDREALELAIIENVQRADLNALEEAIGYRELLDQYAYSQSELAAVIGKSRPHISNTLRLLKLPHEVQMLLRSGELTAGHARALVNHDNPIAAARRIVASGL
ncbi:MAG: ParB/RepB/Spo0J family partition protein, partial [Alphaproteobacteria bacterium]